jgi:hypothetical protein
VQETEGSQPAAAGGATAAAAPTMAAAASVTDLQVNAATPSGDFYMYQVRAGVCEYVRCFWER